MANLQLNLTDLNLTDGTTITVDKMAIIDNNFKSIEDLLSPVTSTPKMDKIDKLTQTSTATAPQIVEVFNKLISELKAKGFMKSE